MVKVVQEHEINYADLPNGGKLVPPTTFEPLIRVIPKAVGRLSLILAIIFILITIIARIQLSVSKKEETREQAKKDFKIALIISGIFIILFVITWIIGIIFKDVELL